MATSMVMKQAAPVVVPASEQQERQPQPQERQQEQRETIAVAEANPSEPMNVDARHEEKKTTNESEKGTEPSVQPNTTDVVMAKEDGSIVKREPTAEDSAPVKKTPTNEVTPVEPDNKAAHMTESEAPQDEDMVCASPRMLDEVAEAPTRVVESAEETRRRAIERTTRRLKIQLEFVENARLKVEDETHPDMAVQLAKLARERERMEEIAHLRAAQLEHGTSVIFAYECDEANSEFEMQCEKLRQEMLEEIHNEMEIINDQRKGGAASARKTSRNTRSTRVKVGSEHAPFAFDTAQKIKKRAGYVFQPLENKLAQSEVDHDLRELTSTFEATKKRRVDADAASLPLAKYYRSRLLYRDWVFQEGDEVYVMNYMASSEYAAVICGITPTEVVVLSEKGKYCRLVIMDLRHGRVVLSTLDGDLTRDDESFASS